jgi:hypothetical protein
MIVNWHAHIFPPEEVAAPEWQGRGAHTIENLLRIHEEAGIDLAVVSNTLNYYEGQAARTGARAHPALA